MAQHARIGWTDRESLSDFIVAASFGVAELDQVARALGQLAQAVFEVAGFVAVLDRFRADRQQRRTVHLPQFLAPLALPRALERQIPTDTQHKACDALGLSHVSSTQCLDHREQYVLGELVDRFCTTQTPTREGSHHRRESLTQLGLGLTLPSSCLADQS